MEKKLVECLDCGSTNIRKTIHSHDKSYEQTEKGEWIEISVAYYFCNDCASEWVDYEK